MLEWLYEQLGAKYEELYQAEGEREELRERLKQSYEELKEHIEQFASESAATEIKVREFGSHIEQIREDIKRINKDFDLYTGI